ncbi:MAG TPA: TPM domain-containing protein [Clostridia bacterium]|nr:TPM domain-containing protein [Clostridia bacterium]
MKKIVALIILIFVLTCNIAFAADIPAPTSDFYVNDTANVITDQTEKIIIDKNAALYEKTGAQIVVVTVDYTHTASIADYAYELFNEYGIGSNEKNNGLLLLLSIGDDDYYALQGAGLERTFSSGTLSYLLYEYLEPYFAQQEYDSGVLSVFNAFYDEILAIYDTNIDYEEPIPDEYEYYYPEEYYSNPQPSITIFDVFRTFFIIVVIIAVLTSIFGSRKSTRSSSSYTRSNTSSNIWPIIGAINLMNMGRNINNSVRNNTSTFNNNHNTINRNSSSFRGSSSFGGGSSFTGRSGGFHSGGGGMSRGGGAGRGGR